VGVRGVNGHHRFRIPEFKSGVIGVGLWRPAGGRARGGRAAAAWRRRPRLPRGAAAGGLHASALAGERVRSVVHRTCVAVLGVRGTCYRCCSHQACHNNDSERAAWWWPLLSACTEPLGLRKHAACCCAQLLSGAGRRRCIHAAQTVTASEPKPSSVLLCDRSS
jgi:hypothetical protein